MMFLQFFIWGGWYVTIGNYMTVMGMSSLTHWAYTVGPIAAIISPFFLGLVADRFFSVEKVLGVMHLIGGVALRHAVLRGSSRLLYPRPGASYALLYADPRADQLARLSPYPGSGTPVSAHPGLRDDRMDCGRGPGQCHTQVRCNRHSPAGGRRRWHPARSLAFGLPHTPPPAAGSVVRCRRIVGLDALAQLRGSAFWIFIACSFLLCIPLAVYYNFAPIFVSDVGLPDPGFQDVVRTDVGGALHALDALVLSTTGRQVDAGGGRRCVGFALHPLCPGRPERCHAP